MPRKFNITDAQHGAAFAVRLDTPAEQVEIVGLQEDGSLMVRLTEASDEGRADAQLIALLADVLEVDPDQVAVVVGQDRPSKIVSVRGVSTGWIEQRLRALY